jgi:hypothetical protein
VADTSASAVSAAVTVFSALIDQGVSEAAIS